MADGSRSSLADADVKHARSTWVRVLIPSVADVIFVAMLGVLLLTSLAVRLLGDAGIGWHIRTGQQILATHAIPRVDSFSSTMYGKPWFAWEWLYDVAVGWLERVAGLNGVVWLTAVILSLAFAWAFRMLVRRGVGLFLALGLVLLAASAAMIHFLARPHVLSWLFTLAWFAILDSSERCCFEGRGRPSVRLLWILPLSMLVWVNAHGGFVVAFVLFAIYWISAVWVWFRLRGNKLDDLLLSMRMGGRIRRLTVAGVLSALATFINPYGWRLPGHICQYLSNRFLIDHIDEFRSPNFHGAAEKCFAIVLLLALVGLAAKRRRLRLSEGLVVLFAIYSGLYASRNIPVSALLLVLVSGPLLSQAIEHVAKERRMSVEASVPTFFGRMSAVESSARGHLWPIAAVILTGLIAANGGGLASRTMMAAGFDAKRFPVAAVDFLERSEAREPVMTPDSWGGYVIYRLHPRLQVVIDDRHDLYGEDFLKGYLKCVHVEPGWESFLRQHQVRRALVPKESALANMLGLSAEWTPLYKDDIAILFEESLSRRRELQDRSH